MKAEAVETCVTACEKYASNNEVIKIIINYFFYFLLPPFDHSHC